MNDDSTIQMLVDPRIGDDYDMGQLKNLTFSASLCIRANAALRPSMTEVNLLSMTKLSRNLH